MIKRLFINALADTGLIVNLTLILANVNIELTNNWREEQDEPERGDDEPISKLD
jgi:hypothetical protein